MIQKTIYDARYTLALGTLFHYPPKPSLSYISIPELKHEFAYRFLLDALIYDQNQMLIKSISHSHKLIVWIDDQRLWYSISCGRSLTDLEIRQRNTVERYLQLVVARQQEYKQIMDQRTREIITFIKTNSPLSDPSSKIYE